MSRTRFADREAEDAIKAEFGPRSAAVFALADLAAARHPTWGYRLRLDWAAEQERRGLIVGLDREDTVDSLDRGTG